MGESELNSQLVFYDTAALNPNLVCSPFARWAGFAFDVDHLAPSSLFQVISWQPIDRKINFYKQVLEATYSDIFYTENTLLYNRATSIVQRQLEKAFAINAIVDQLSSLRSTPASAEYFQHAILAEQRLDEFSDVFTLQHELRHLLYSSMPSVDFSAKKKANHQRRDLLMRGRMQRRFFRRVVRDIRRFFRTLVRTLFKQMNDQSGDDEFMVQAVLCRSTIYSIKIWFLHGQARNYSPH
jgi:hypothetical protein